MSNVIAVPVPRRRSLDAGVRFAIAAFVLLLGLNLVFATSTLAFSNLGTTIGLAAPLILVAFAVTITLLAGNGAIDLSVGPAAGLVNVVVVHELVGNSGITSPVAIVLAALGTGLAVGIFNGVVVAYLRIQPIVATLGSYLICIGITLTLMDTPGGSTPAWLSNLAGTTSLIPIAAVFGLWLLLRQTPFYVYLIATSDDERTAFASGVNTARIRVAVYALGGLVAGVAGLALTAVLGSADPNIGSTYTLSAIAAAVFGGVSLAGSKGGLANALLGAAAIFLLQNLLTSLHTSTFLLQ
ncbi:MAG: ABC transporter permease, partial [Patulibacter sp.]